MTFASPLGLLALGALVPLFFAYFLRRRQKPRTVSALFLWRSPTQRAQAGPRFERFSRELSLLLETLAVIAAALYLADLRTGKDAPKRHLVVVVDGSLSMRAQIDGERISEKVVHEVNHRVQSEGAALLTVVESGRRPRIIVGPQAAAAKGVGDLAGWIPAQPAHDFGPALLLARELVGAKGRPILLLTDGPAATDPVWPEEVEVKSLGAKADNLAFLAALRHDEAGVASVTLRVGSFSTAKRDVEVVLKGEGVEQREKVSLEPGGEAVVHARVKTTGPLTADLPTDALADDSHLTLAPSPTAEVSVALLEGLDGRASSATRRVLALMPDTALNPESPVTVGPVGSEAFVTLGATGKLRSFVGPFFQEKTDPLLEDVRLDGVVWTVGDNPPGRPLVSLGDAVMVSRDAHGHLHLNVELARSDLERTAAWPVLWANLIREARLRAPGFPRKLVMLGEPAPVVTDGSGSFALQSPSGSRQPLFGTNATPLPLDQAGTWQLLKDGKAFDALTVLPLDARESDLRTRGPYQVAPRINAGLGETKGELPRPRWPIALLLVLLLADFALSATPLFSGDRASPPKAGGAT